jgi:transcriptional regulator with XRE-family HTH domain
MNALWITGAGAVIRSLRGKRPIGDVAKQLGIAVSTLSLIERNQRRLSIADIAKFAEIIEMAPSYLFALCLDEIIPKMSAEEQTLLSFISEKLKQK